MLLVGSDQRPLLLWLNRKQQLHVPGTEGHNCLQRSEVKKFRSVHICSDLLRSSAVAVIVEHCQSLTNMCRIVSNRVEHRPTCRAAFNWRSCSSTGTGSKACGTVAPWHSGRWLKLTETANSANSVNSTFSDFVWKSNPRGIAEILFNASPADCEWYFWAVHKIQNGTTWFQIQQHPPFPHLTL